MYLIDLKNKPQTFACVFTGAFGGNL